ncbi:MAG: bifunctional DNA-formamidopyrimidine glycosylase/DNA-(apurinic or apyrimidinic site) lyase [Planctomycetes bacterium]|nr:bifunctional DNA-formamidopyrimidine glycosylase/DNA-(apurinic or apyrimidinic site) lyase [Planctomycetota bacterium]MCW8134499.1 bifunctional DNA-formamidopyrimidine glycosylase/DNA-(apurinic or apyrimidinic site) lyase [Planctomycetota bacterium]
MPELPEVEVTRRKIAPALVGRVIAGVRTTAPSYFFLTPPPLLKRRLKGRTVTALARVGKYLLATLDDGSRLLIHLGMTGQLFVQGSSSLRLLSSTARATLKPEQQPAFKPDKHTHLRLSFSDGGPEVWFRDTRKFGKVKWLAPGERDARLAKLGPDALEVTGAEFHATARRRRVPVKTVLLDQGVLAGVGNIYADEALFLTGLRPTRKANTLSRAQCSRLVASVQRVLKRSIETGGSSISDYVAPDGQDGAYQDERMVYDREGQPCKVCGAPIKRVVIGQRSAHFCPKCQN